MKIHEKQLAAFELAKTEIGLKEITGPEHEAKIVQFFKDVGHDWVKDDETAWCAAFVGAMLERSGLKSTRALNARSYLDWEGAVSIDLEDAEPGDIVIFRRGSSSWQGHVAFYVGHGNTSISCLSGNQSNAVNIQAYDRRKLLGIRRMPAPEPEAVPGLWATILSIIGNLFRRTK